ncbi:hypothetical protein AB4Y32_25370 [Paraburkholderia phymatum]|uniref:Uncharacterized protein n=1 Tax=Paraburkholderia phymatum TaxID=148447 RepID=A0ACC6U698_9BURK
MEEALNNRVAKLEFRADAQDTEIKALKKTQETFGESLKAIEKILLQIKWALYGAGLFAACNWLGVKEVITKLVLH